MRLPDPVVTSDQCCQRYRFRRREGCIPAGAVFHGFDGLAFWVGVFIGSPLPYELLAGFRMLSLAQSSELTFGDRSGESHRSGQSPLPLANGSTLLAPVILLFGGELFGVVGLRLRCTQRL